MITLDDITDLVTAQRTSAWADVARRIAHEIKNPLTPIQLSAERLKRKYGRVITEDREIFDQCTDTIIRQVGRHQAHGGRVLLVRAHAEGAARTSMTCAPCVNQVVFLMRVGHPEITIEDEITGGSAHARFDRRLISQALTNIVKNATEGIAGETRARTGRRRAFSSGSRAATTASSPST